MYIWTHAEPILLFLGQVPEEAALTSVFLDTAIVGLPAFAFNEIIK